MKEKNIKSAKNRGKSQSYFRRNFLYLIPAVILVIITLLFFPKKSHSPIYVNKSTHYESVQSPPVSKNITEANDCSLESFATAKKSSEGPLFLLCSHLALQLPNEALTDGPLVTLSGVTYKLYIGAIEGGDERCPMYQEEKTHCTYDDEVLPNISTFRIWRNDTGVFKLNPQSLQKDNYFLNHFQIDKVSPSVTFSPEEIDEWRRVLKNVVSL